MNYTRLSSTWHIATLQLKNELKLKTNLDQICLFSNLITILFKTVSFVLVSLEQSSFLLVQGRNLLGDDQNLKIGMAGKSKRRRITDQGEGEAFFSFLLIKTFVTFC